MSEPFNTNDTINAARDTLASMTGLRAAYSIPDDADAGLVDFEHLPVLTVGMALRQPMRWDRHAAGKGLWFWHLDLFLFLERGEMRSELQAAHAMKLHEGWFKKVADKLMKNMSLGVPQTSAGSRGSGGNVYTPEIGHYQWSETQTFWGIGFIVPVSQYHSQSTSRSE